MRRTSTTPSNNELAQSERSSLSFSAENAKHMVRLYDALAGIELAKGFSSSSITPNPLGKSPFYFAQLLLSFVFAIQPKLKPALKITHIFVSLYATARFAISIVLYLNNINCSADTTGNSNCPPVPQSNWCKGDAILQAVFQGYVLCMLILAKVLEHKAAAKLEKEKEREREMEGFSVAGSTAHASDQMSLMFHPKPRRHAPAAPFHRVFSSMEFRSPLRSPNEHEPMGSTTMRSRSTSQH